MNLKAEHSVDDGGNHHVMIDGLRVWLRKDGQFWVANGIDIDYATAGESREQAARAFAVGFCLTLIEHVKRFNSLEKLLSRRAPDEIYSAWIRAIESNELDARTVNLDVPESEIRGLTSHAAMPSALRFFEPAHA